MAKLCGLFIFPIFSPSVSVVFNCVYVILNLLFFSFFPNISSALSRTIYASAGKAVIKCCTHDFSRQKPAYGSCQLGMVHYFQFSIPFCFFFLVFSFRSGLFFSLFHFCFAFGFLKPFKGMGGKVFFFFFKFFCFLRLCCV